MSPRARILAVLCAGASLSACAPGQPAPNLPSETTAAPVPVREIRFGVPPVQDSRLLWSRWHAFIDQLNLRCARCVGFRLRLESALTSPTYDARVRRGDLDIVLVEPHRVLQYEAFGYRVFARVATQDRIGGAVVVRTDRSIDRPRRLLGKTIAFSVRDALASTMLVRHWFRERTGLDLARVSTPVYVGSDYSALRAVAVGDADAAGVSRSAWEEFRTRYPHWGGSLEARWYTDTLSGPALMAHSRLARIEVRGVESALLALVRDEAGREAIRRTGYHGFRAAAGASYDDVWEFVQNYARIFREGGLRRRA